MVVKCIIGFQYLQGNISSDNDLVYSSGDPLSNLIMTTFMMRTLSTGPSDLMSSAYSIMLEYTPWYQFPLLWNMYHWLPNSYIRS